MTDKELIRRALLGDKHAQAECTERGVVLPCPCCGGKARLEDMGFPHHVYCTKCGLKSTSTKYGDEGESEAIHKWNTRPAIPKEQPRGVFTMIAPVEDKDTSGLLEE